VRAAVAAVEAADKAGCTDAFLSEPNLLAEECSER